MLNTQKISTLIRIRPGETTSPTFGVIGSVYIQVVVDGTPDRIPINLAWPVDCFDPDKEQLKPRYPEDQECYINNQVIIEEKAKANRLSMELYVSGREVTAKEFKTRFKNFASRKDFIQYIIVKREQLYRIGEVTEGTYKKYLTVIHRMQQFFNHGQAKDSRSDFWKFHVMDLTIIKMFESWLINKEELSHNTMTGTMKILHKFLELAKVDDIKFNDPMKGYTMPKFTPGIREALNLEELKALKTYYLKDDLTDHEKDVLERYLFACFTGLRKSDVEQFDTRLHLRNGRLNLTMFKTRKYNKSVEFKLPAFALQIIGKRRGRLWPAMESSLLNKTLRKVIGRMNIQNVWNGDIVIDKHVVDRSGRDTFATNFLRLGGMLIVLKDILGHGSITMTEIYVKMANDESDDTMDKFDSI